MTTAAADAATPKASKVKKILLGILAAFVALIAIISVAASMQPTNFDYSRSATFKATPAAVFEQVNDFHKWDAWSPWANLDPNCKVVFEGPTSGEGAKFSWDGDNNVGAGSMTIVESKPGDVVRIKLEFLRPMAGVCDTTMKIEPKGDETQLTWRMTGENGFPAKVMSLFMDCEKMCGDMFNEGLENMRKIVEAKPAETAPEKPSA
jgi:carbon monoxide dehydrogenase subunit G